MIRRLLDLRGHSTSARASELMIAAIVAASVGGYLFNLVAIRWLGASGYGEVAALTSVALMVSLPLVAVQNAVGRDVAALSASARTREVAALVRSWFARMAACGLVLGGLTAASVEVVRDRLGIESRLSVWLTAIAIAVSAVLPVTQGTLQGLQRFGWFGASIAFWGLARPALAPPLILVGGVDGAMAAIAVAAVVPVAMTMVAVHRALRRLPATGTQAVEAAHSPLWPVVFGVSGFAVLTNVDVVVAKAALSAHDAGNYASAALVGKLVLFAATGITLVLLPRATAFLVTDAARVGGAVRGGLFAVVAFGLATAAALAPLPESAVLWLFGPTFGDARGLLAPFALAMTVAAVAHVLLTTAFAAGERRYPTVLALVAAADVVALAAFGHSSAAILAITAASAGAAVVVYEAVARLPLRRLLAGEVEPVPGLTPQPNGARGRPR